MDYTLQHLFEEKYMEEKIIEGLACLKMPVFYFRIWMIDGIESSILEIIFT